MQLRCPSYLHIIFYYFGVNVVALLIHYVNLLVQLFAKILQEEVSTVERCSFSFSYIGFQDSLTEFGEFFECCLHHPVDTCRSCADRPDNWSTGTFSARILSRSSFLTCFSFSHIVMAFFRSLVWHVKTQNDVWSSEGCHGLQVYK